MVGPVQATGLPKVSSEPQTPSDAFRQRLEELERERAREGGGVGAQLEPRSTGVRFQPFDNPRVIQAKVVDRRSEEVLREVPTTAHLRFARKFREIAADFVGRFLDVRA